MKTFHLRWCPSALRTKTQMLPWPTRPYPGWPSRSPPEYAMLPPGPGNINNNQIGTKIFFTALVLLAAKTDDLDVQH